MNANSTRLCRAFLPSIILGCTLACQSTPGNQSSEPTEANQNKPSAQSPAYQSLAPATFAETLAVLPNEQLIDVRTPDEYQSGHLAHSTLIDFKGKNFREQMATLDKDRPVMVYCAAGGRSTAAAALLEELGFPEIYELEGGIARWRSAKLAVEQ